MFASTPSNAAAVVLLALVIVPAPLLPPLGLTGKVQSLLGVGWQTAYLAAAIGVHLALYGSLITAPPFWRWALPSAMSGWRAMPD
jgi:hypothetical protein